MDSFRFSDLCLGVFVLSVSSLFFALALGVAGCVDSPAFRAPAERSTND